MRHSHILASIAGFVFGCVALAHSAQSLSQEPALARVRAVEASGNWFAFALMSDGTVYGWGYNSSGRVGDATTIRRDVPVKVQACRDAAGAFKRVTSDPESDCDCESQGGTLGDLTGVKELSSGINHTLALLDNGTPARVSDDYVVAWGYGSKGQLGDGMALSSRTTRSHSSRTERFGRGAPTPTVNSATARWTSARRRFRSGAVA